MSKSKFGIKARKRQRKAIEWKAIQMNVVTRIKKDVRREEVTTGYVEHNRYIHQDIYERLKRKKFCDYCHKPLVHLPQIHHKIAICDGGSNLESNLMAVHKSCHEILDQKQREVREKLE